MPLSIPSPSSQIILNPEPLTQEKFSSFGTVISNPSPTLIPSLHLTHLPPTAILANQGTAIKYQDVTHMKNLYRTAPSQKPGKAVMNMFVCAPRALQALPSKNKVVAAKKERDDDDNNNTSTYFPLTILERHPYTTQTFIPLSLSPSSSPSRKKTRYLVIVAPSLPPSKADSHFPVPPPPTPPTPPPSTKTQPIESASGEEGEGEGLPGRGLPDLSRLRVFWGSGDQAVTYGAGTWHAPMAVIGEEAVDFVVVQFANGVSLEDCQEVVFAGGGEEGRREEGTGLLVNVDVSLGRFTSKL